MTDKNKWLFIFTNVPGVPSQVDAMFPMTKSAEAYDYYRQGNGYLLICEATWNYGALPEYNETKHIMGI